MSYCSFHAEVNELNVRLFEKGFYFDICFAEVVLKRVFLSVRIEVAHLRYAVCAVGFVLHSLFCLGLVLVSYLIAKVRIFADMTIHISLICVNILLIYVNT